MNTTDRVVNEIPADAFNLEVFAIKKSEVDGLQAYIGFKIPNGNFHYVQVPYTEPQSTTPIQLEEGELEQMAMDLLKYKWAHLYSFGYPRRPFPTNYKNDLDCVLLGLYKTKAAYQQRSSERVFSLKDIEDAFDAGYDKYGAEWRNTEYGEKDDIPDKEQYLSSIK